MTNTTAAHVTTDRLPFVVCPACEGHGTRANPVFDGMSASADEFDGNTEERDEFLAEYTTRGGIYDIPCDACRGKRVVRAECECSDCEEERQDYYNDLAAEAYERRYC